MKKIVLEYNASKACKKQIVDNQRAKRAEIGTFSPMLAKLRFKDYLFSVQKRTYIFSIFKVRVFISKKRQPPFPQNQMVVP